MRLRGGAEYAYEAKSELDSDSICIVRGGGSV